MGWKGLRFEWYLKEIWKGPFRSSHELLFLREISLARRLVTPLIHWTCEREKLSPAGSTSRRVPCFCFRFPHSSGWIKISPNKDQAGMDRNKLLRWTNGDYVVWRWRTRAREKKKKSLTLLPGRVFKSENPPLPVNGKVSESWRNSWKRLASEKRIRRVRKIQSKLVQK